MEIWAASQDIYKMSKDQPTNQSENQQINRPNVNLLQQTLAFQSAFISFSILFPSFSQVLSISQHSVISFLHSENISLEISTFYFQVLFNFPTQYYFHIEIQCLLQQFQHSIFKFYSSLSIFNTVLFHSSKGNLTFIFSI